SARSQGSGSDPPDVALTFGSWSVASIVTAVVTFALSSAGGEHGLRRRGGVLSGFVLLLEEAQDHAIVVLVVEEDGVPGTALLTEAVFFARARLASFSAKVHQVSRCRLSCSKASCNSNWT